MTLGEVIEDYPEHVRGHSLGAAYAGRKLHVVCAPHEYLAIITAYVPEANEWAADFKKRRPL